MSYKIIGKDFIPPDIRAKVTGKAKYAEDFRLEGMVFCRLLTSPVPHAKISNINYSEALAMEGVLGVLTADEVPEQNNVVEPILTNEPLYVGDPILAVAATSEAIAQDAIDSIQINYDVLPFTLDPLESLYPGGPDARSDGNIMKFANPRSIASHKWTARDFVSVDENTLPMGEPTESWSFGDLQSAFNSSDLLIDETFVTAGNSHLCMEPRTTMANWENNKCYIYGSTQSQSAIMPGLANFLGIKIENLVYIGEFCGGGFGSKAAPYSTMAIPAFMSKKIQRPVMMRISRAEEFYIGRARPGFQGRVKLGFRNDGRMMAADLYVVQENGPYRGFDDFDAAASAVSLLYQPEALRMQAVPVETNTPPRAAMRGPGENQIAAAVEPLIDKAAKELNIDRIEIRRVNAADNDAKYYANQGPVTSAYQRECLDKGLSMWNEMKQRSGQKNGSKVRGVGIGQGFHPAGRNGYDGLIRITPDGKLHIHSGVGNLGTYSHTSTSRVAAEVLKYNWDNCVVVRGDSRKHLAWSPTQSGSNTSFTTTRQSYVAAIDALQKIKEIAALDMGGSEEDYDIAGEEVFLILEPTKRMTFSDIAKRAIEIGGKYSGYDSPEDLHPITKSSVSSLAGTGLIGVSKDNLYRNGLVAGIAVGFIEIELDIETGKFEIIDYLGVSDCGTVLHPKGLSTQISGGAVQGFGLAAFEKHIYDPQNGLPGNLGFLDHKPASYLDVPSVMKTAAAEIPDPQNPVGAKGMGEPVQGCAAAALVCAISDALGGHYFNRVPITPDMIVNVVSGRGQSHSPLDVNTA